MFGQFSTDTSLHGVKHISDSSKGVRRYFWTSAVVLMMALLIYVVVNQVLKFTAYPFYTVLTLRQAHKLPFPSVTICNSNLYRKSFVETDPVAALAFRTMYDRGPKAPKANFSDPSVSSKNTDCDPRDFMAEAAHQLKDMFRHCTWMSDPVNCSEHFRARFTNHGLCYTFNSQQHIAARGRLAATFPGDRGGLTVNIDIQEHEYFYGVSSSKGIKVLVHEPHISPNILNKGFLVGPGTKVSAATTLTKIQCLPPPYLAMGKEPCLDTLAKGFQSPLDFHPNYDLEACHAECAAKTAIAECGCQHFDNAGNVSFCSIREMIQCYGPARAKIERSTQSQEQCGCLRQCRWNQYEVSVSSGSYPMEHDTVQFMENRNVSREYVLTNYLELSVFYDQLVFKELEQVPAYTAVDIVANLGGQLGIFLGASFLTLTEVGEYVLGAAFAVFQRRKKTPVHAWTAENTDRSSEKVTTETKS